ncbi:MAG TPA: DUF481 domain-containing protein [Noviherbaspirillum sp.]
MKTRTSRSSLRPTLKALALALLAAQLAHAADPASPEFKAGYEAGYKAAMEALRAGAAGATAAAVATPAPRPVPGQATAGAPEPGDWWSHSARLYRQIDPAWRHHVELQFSATDLHGNDTGHALRGNGKLFSRSGLWTNELIGSLDKRKIVQAGGAINQRDYKMLQDSVRYDLTAKLYGSGGFIIERDDVNFIDRRNTLLAGLGYYALDNERMRLNLFAGLGRLKETYLQPVPSLIGIDGRNSNLLYLYETFDWQIAEKWSLQQGFRQIRDLDESGRYTPDPLRPGLYAESEMVKRYRNLSNVTLNYQLSPRSALSFGVERRYDSNPWPDVKSTDTIKRLSLNLMY